LNNFLWSSCLTKTCGISGISVSAIIGIPTFIALAPVATFSSSNAPKAIANANILSLQYFIICSVSPGFIPPKVNAALIAQFNGYIKEIVSLP